MMKCPLCGFGFDEGAKTSCGARPMGKGCGFTCCPRNGYKFITEPKAINLINRVLGRKRPDEARK